MLICFSFIFHLQFFVAPPLCCPQPRWFSNHFSVVYEAFASTFKQALPNVHVVDLYKTDPSMYELDGKHLKSFCGKDYVDHIISCADAGMIRASLDGDVRASEADNRLSIVEGRVDLVQRDLARGSQRLDVVAARAAEDEDGYSNEKYAFADLLFV